jgi:hypothetical protein
MVPGGYEGTSNINLGDRRRIRERNLLSASFALSLATNTVHDVEAYVVQFFFELKYDIYELGTAQHVVR